jgi:hypothetical protein
MNQPEPMLIEVPGIPGKLRSQTLDEYMSALIPEHPARVELSNLRGLALEGMKSTHKLLELLSKINDLEEKVRQLTTPADPAPFVTITAPPLGDASDHSLPATLPAEVVAKATPFPRAACPECGKMISTMIGPWKSHMLAKHGKTSIAPPDDPAA